MPEFFKLRNGIKHYEWGSPDFIPRLMNISGGGRPWAELWMGVHPGSPSFAELPGGGASLGKLIAGDPVRYLGEEAALKYSTLPFLFKLLAAEKPLSIQAHPDKERARQGFNRENAAGLPQDDPGRCYRDSNHKPEIICALTPFTGMCGFREPGEIKRLLAGFLDPAAPAPLREGFLPLFKALESPGPSGALENFLNALFGLSAGTREALAAYILSGREAGGGVERELIRNFAGLYPGDPAVIAPLYLNVFRLEPGEALFLKAGVLHAYCRGFGVELMANSDNVLRGGLTSKHVDVHELMKALDFRPMKPGIMKVPADSRSYVYPAPCEEFSLAVMRCGGGEMSRPPAAHGGPSICVVTEGEALVSGGDGGMVLKQGESAFFPPAVKGGKAPVFRGRFTLYAAFCGSPLQ
ncbi:MAG: mannose-6-phosphate isomerase, class I [Treponema sp.]|nr:mannose-6-phosphate isomerase, class I [Treponema sp.]